MFNYMIDPYEESGMAHADFGEIEPPPCAGCPLACGNWSDMMLCSPDHYIGLVGRYYGTGSSLESNCAVEEGVPF